MPTQTMRPSTETDVLALCGTDPKAFLTGYFHTLPGEGDESIGPRLCELWPGVADLLDTLIRDRRVIGLKSRKIGFTTTGLAFALWVATFYSFSRCHLFSYRDDAAIELIKRIRFAWRRLPDFMRLPESDADGSANDVHTITLSGAAMSGDPDDVRVIKAYPTTTEASADETADFVMVDEAARIPKVHELFNAIEPTVRHWLLLISSGRGPEGEFVETWTAAKSGAITLTPRFYPWYARADRSVEWRAEKMSGYVDQARAKREYPETEADALVGDAIFVFPGWAIDRAHEGATGILTSPVAGRDYVHFWDIGKLADAAVGTVLDVTDQPFQVVGWSRLTGVPYPILQREIETLFGTFGGQLFIENNGPGEPVIDNLAVPAEGRATGARVKVEMISKLKHYVEHGWIKWSGLPQLDREMRSYQWDDKRLVQDSVMSLAGAVQNAPVGDMIGVG